MKLQITNDTTTVILLHIIFYLKSIFKRRTVLERGEETNGKNKWERESKSEN